MSNQVFGPPWQEPSTGQALQMLLGRVQALEQEPVIATYEIKCSADGEPLTTGVKFKFPIPPSLDGARLLSAWGGVSEVSSSGNIDVQVENHTQSVDMLLNRVVITVGEECGPGSPDPDNNQVAVCDWVWIEVDSAGTDAEGLVIVLEFAQ